MAVSDITGLIVDIERFSTQNGPGIRTTAFLKGCPLRCKWCGNPETQRCIPEIMVAETRCTGCGDCVSVCKNDAIRLNGGKVSVRFKRCLNCLQCTGVCNEGAIRKAGSRYTPQALYAAVSRDREFYGTRGGVTFTGGEPLLQWEFLLPVLQKLKEDGIGVCMDTTGEADWSVLEQIKDYVTIFLYDVKHTDPTRHKEGTGVSNRRILENLRKLSASGARIWLRVPVIPGFNDSDADIVKVACLAESLHVERLCLLPFHTLGKEKYHQLGRAFPMGDAETYPREKMSGLEKLAKKYFAQVSVS